MRERETRTQKEVLNSRKTQSPTLRTERLKSHLLELTGVRLNTPPPPTVGRKGRGVTSEAALLCKLCPYLDKVLGLLQFCPPHPKFWCKEKKMGGGGIWQKGGGSNLPPQPFLQTKQMIRKEGSTYKNLKKGTALGQKQAGKQLFQIHSRGHGPGGEERDRHWSPRWQPLHRRLPETLLCGKEGLPTNRGRQQERDAGDPRRPQGECQGILSGAASAGSLLWTNTDQKEQEGQKAEDLLTPTQVPGTSLLPWGWEDHTDMLGAETPHSLQGLILPCNTVTVKTSQYQLQGLSK